MLEIILFDTEEDDDVPFNVRTLHAKEVECRGDGSINVTLPDGVEWSPLIRYHADLDQFEYEGKFNRFVKVAPC